MTRDEWPPRAPWDDGRQDSPDHDPFGPGEGDPKGFQVTALVEDTHGRNVEAGERFEAGFVTISRREAFAITRAEMFFQSQGLEVVSDIEAESFEVEPSLDGLREVYQRMKEKDERDRPEFV